MVKPMGPGNNRELEVGLGIFDMFCWGINIEPELSLGAWSLIVWVRDLRTAGGVSLWTFVDGRSAVWTLRLGFVRDPNKKFSIGGVLVIDHRTSVQAAVRGLRYFLPSSPDLLLPFPLSSTQTRDNVFGPLSGVVGAIGDERAPNNNGSVSPDMRADTVWSKACPTDPRHHGALVDSACAADLRDMNKSLKGKWAALACHETDSIIVQLVLTFLVQHAFENLEESVKDGIVDELLGQGGVVFGEHVLEHGLDKYRQMALEHLLAGLLEYATNEQGSKSVVKARKVGGKDTLDRGVQRMCEPAKGSCILDRDLHAPPVPLLPAPSRCLGPARPTPYDRKTFKLITPSATFFLSTVAVIERDFFVTRRKRRGLEADGGINRIWGERGRPKRGDRALREGGAWTSGTGPQRRGSGRGPCRSCILDRDLHAPPVPLLPAPSRCLGPARPTPADKEQRAAVRLHPRPHRHAARVQDGLEGYLAFNGSSVMRHVLTIFERAYYGY
ncbi:hypothetical protein C8R44DRAFT_856789 [Mycena epipterygia]|nr:hypothetical protein C8R44DRAFT_856789 [Mycena epipterygia]